MSRPAAAPVALDDPALVDTYDRIGGVAALRSVWFVPDGSLA